MAPHVPTRMNVSAPMAMSSSSALAVDGPPAPVEHAEMGPPSTRRPVNVTCSRSTAISRASAQRVAIIDTRAGSPGRST